MSLCVPISSPFVFAIVALGHERVTRCIPEENARFGDVGLSFRDEPYAEVEQARSSFPLRKTPRTASFGDESTFAWACSLVSRPKCFYYKAWGPEPHYIQIACGCPSTGPTPEPLPSLPIVSSYPLRRTGKMACCSSTIY